MRRPVAVPAFLALLAVLSALPLAAQQRQRRRPKAGAPAAKLSLPSGAAIAGTTTGQLSSAVNRKGDQVTVTVDEDVKDRAGKVVIPAGSTINIVVDSIRHSENRDQRTVSELLVLRVSGVTVAGKTSELRANVDSAQYEFKGRGGAVGDASKVAAGAAIGALAGRVLGGDSNRTRNTLLGAAAGAAIGTQRAIETKDADIVLPAGKKVWLSLTAAFTR
ncbi:MAG: glycine zipper 2TM domain-containing protein [Gemmatimonadales bacterium]|nr:glycine zipper 2TM domain-containing protein [Gemmatimonadales bacterium]